MSVASQASSAAHLKAHAAAQAAAGYVPQSVGSANVNLPPVPPITTSLPPPKITSIPPSTSSPPANDVSHENDELLWKLDLDGVKPWIQRILFPKTPKQRLDAHGQPLQAGSIRGDAEAYRLEQVRLQNEEWKFYTERSAIVKVLFNNLILALDSATGKTTVEQQSGNDTKRMKVESGASITTSFSAASSRDEYAILDPSFAKGKEITHLPGAIVSRILMGGLVNALAGQIGGIVDVMTCMPLLPEKKDAPIPTANGQTLTQLRDMFVTRLHSAISARLEIDKLNSIPTRIVEMLCPEITMTEIAGIRQRIYDTVVLGRGTHSSSAAAALEGEEDLAVLARVDKNEFKKCGGCGNNDQNKFVMDQKNGDLICKDCGTIVEESLMHEGSQFRKFEGEADRNHHGDVANPLYSNSYNMGTSLGGMSFQSGAGLGGYGSGGRGGIENVLRNAHAYIEMNMSQFGKEEKKTRIGYKDRQKREAVIEMKHVVDALSLHNAVIERAKELFAGFRDDRELVQQFKGVLAACLCQAFDQLSKDGRQILKQKAGEEECVTSEVKEDTPDNVKRDNVKRESLHGATLARKTMVDSPMSATEKKSASLWDLDDTRSWLLETSRTIARKWEQKNQIARSRGISDSHTPQGRREEIEGKLVEHTLTLCDLMENELKGKISAVGKQRVVTPRVQTMGHLGIRWQKSHERGSGGAGGVGNSGQVVSKTGRQSGSNKTAGQILILKSAKRLGEAIKDPVAGEAFHGEVRALLKRQEVRAKKLRSDEAIVRRSTQRRRKRN